MPTAFATAAAAFLVAAIAATAALWPDTSTSYDDPDPALKAYALLAGASLLVPATVCWVGAVVAAKLEALVKQKG